ncbi:MAG: hypothetical protein HFE39_09130 [Clostridiales bacterium]|jgi:hypothetical protein|nr:hypothetical protein [Clostridiales bacterium]
MNDQNRVDELLKNALSHQRAPSFLPIQERAVQARSAPSNRTGGRAAVLRRLAFSCSVLVLFAWGLGMLGTFSGGVSFPENAVPMASLASELRQEDGNLNHPYTPGGVSSTGAILYNILPSDKLLSQDVNDVQESTVSFSSDEETSLIPQARKALVGAALLRAIERNPDGVFDVVADIENADVSSESVSHLLNRFLLYLDSTNYYIQINAQQIEQYAQANIKVMLVGQGPPIRPQGYPDAFDVGSAWIYNNSTEGSKLSVVLTSPLPDNAQDGGKYTYETAVNYLTDALPQVGITAPEPSSYIEIETEEGAPYATYAASLDRQSALAAVGSGLVTQIQAIPRSRSSNPVEQQYYYMVYGDGWVFSN